MMKFEDGRGGNMLIPDEEKEFNIQDLENIRCLELRSVTFINTLEDHNPFAIELDIEKQYLKTLQKIEKWIEKQ